MTKKMSPEMLQYARERAAKRRSFSKSLTFADKIQNRLGKILAKQKEKKNVVT